MRARLEADRAGQALQLTAAWYAAAFGRVKKMPALRDFLGPLAGPRPRQSWQEQLAIIKQHHAAAVASAEAAERRSARRAKRAQAKVKG